LNRGRTYYDINYPSTMANIELALFMFNLVFV